MILQHPGRILLAALFAAWSFDFLFRNKSPGISNQTERIYFFPTVPR